jgi:hypothetical protein
MAKAKHAVSGQIIDVPAHYIGHPVLGKNLVAVNAPVQAAPKKETPIKEQPAPSAPVIPSEPIINIEENEE